MKKDEIKNYLKKIRIHIKYTVSHPEIYETTNKNTHCLYCSDSLDLKQKTILGFKIIKTNKLKNSLFYFGYLYI